MTNLALVTRPSCFSELIGQEKVVDQTINYLNHLRSNLQEQTVPIILSGPRGTGKTSTGRLIAKYLNCEKQETDITIHCTCDNCQAIADDPDGAIDYLELDGASNNGVADMQGLVDLTFYAPIGSWKIILIDECQMLTRNAWNLLLKQLEEPPLHVLYILATTEESKIIPTVRSRSKMRRFSLLHQEQIIEYLYEIVTNTDLVENTQGFDDPEIVEFIAEMAKGSLRDAVTFLGDVLDLTDRTLLSIQQAVGSADVKKVGQMLHLLLNGKIGEALIELIQIEKAGAAPKTLMEQAQLLLADLLNVKEGAEATRILPVEYYKEKFEGVNVTHVAGALGSFLEVSGIARNTITYVTLTYAFVAVKNLMIEVAPLVLDTPKQENLFISETFPANQEVATTANRLSQLFTTTTGKFKRPDTPQITTSTTKTKEEEENYF